MGSRLVNVIIEYKSSGFDGGVRQETDFGIILGTTYRSGGIMKRTHMFTVIIEEEGDGFVALCPELDVASQGGSVEEARSNLKEAVELFLETADETEIKDRLHGNVFVTQMEVAVG